MPQYNGVWTLEQQAQAQSNQQWVTDPNFKNTTLLLQADNAANGATNNTFLDSSTNSFVVTRNGNTTQGSFSPFSQAPGYWGNYFTTSDGLSIGTAVSVGNTWTLECWFSVQQTGQTILVNGNGATGDPWIGLNNGTVQISFASVTRSFTAPYSLYTWYHLALTCNAGTVTVYLNGVQQGATQSSPTTNLTINRIAGYNGGGANAWNGYISNLRITNTVVYSSNFTPQTTPLTAISGTALLTCQSNRFVDNSATAAAITVNAGTPSVQAFGPFAPALQWTPDVVGGSGYFDGTGDYLTVGSGTDVDLGTSDFMIEAWYYCLANGTYASGVISKRVGGVASGWGMTTSGFVCDMAGTWYDSWANPFWVGSTQNSGFNSGTSLQKLNQWTHIVVTRQGTDARWFVNGQLLGYFSRTGAIQQLTGSPLAVGLNGTTSEQPFIGYISNVRVVVGSVPTGYQTSSTTLNTQIFTPPTSPVTTTSQSVTSGNIKYLGNYTNAGIYDGKMANNLETVGNAQVSTSVVKYGSGSMAFDGTGDYLVMPQSPTLSVGSGNFTYEMWLFPTDITDTCIFDTRTTNNTTTGFAFLINGSSFLAVYTNGTVLTCTTPIASGVWQHVAVVRSNGILYVYLNGVSVGSAAFTNTLSDKTFRLGAYVDNTGNFNGYIDDMRLTNGLARYFTTFTPPQQALPRQ